MRIEVAPARSDEEARVYLETQFKIWPWRSTLEGFRHRERVWAGAVHLLARLDGEPAGTGFVGSFPGTEEQPAVGSGLGVVAEHRSRGVGGALYEAVSVHARSLGKDTLTGEVLQDDPDSLAWARRREFVEVERQEAVALDLAEHEPLPVEPPTGIEIVTRAERPDLARQMYEVGLEAGRDVPGLEGITQDPDFEQWASFEIERPSRDPELCFIALADGRVVGFASLDVFPDDVFHGLTAVAQSWRHRGVGTTLKRAQIAAAKSRGYRRLLTESQHENEPMRRLNEKLGFRPEPSMSTIVLRGPLAS